MRALPAAPTRLPVLGVVRSETTECALYFHRGDPPVKPMSNAFLPGHRIRLDVTSSDFPSYDRNHNKAADQNADAILATAAQTIHHGGAYAARIIPPTVPGGPAEGTWR